MTISPTILLVPGLRDHVEAHWQTILEKKLPNARSVAPLEHDKLSCAARVGALEEALARIDGPVVLVAHSAGAMIVAHWAAQSRRPIHGALLAAPADIESPLPAGYPTLAEIGANGWLPLPRRPLPFPSIVAASTDDALGDFERIGQFARDWCAQLVELGPVGHLNPAAGFGEWQQAEALIAQLL